MYNKRRRYSLAEHVLKSENDSFYSRVTYNEHAVRLDVALLLLKAFRRLFVVRSADSSEMSDYFARIRKYDGCRTR